MGVPDKVIMRGGNIIHQGEGFGDENDLLIITMEFLNNTYALMEYGLAFRYNEQYVLIQGSEGYIRLDMQDVGVKVKTKEYERIYLLHASTEEDNDLYFAS